VSVRATRHGLAPSLREEPLSQSDLVVIADWAGWW